MIRILEVLVSLVIVFVLAVIIGVLLPDHGHVERSVEVSSPVRQVYDSLNTFRRFPQWSALRSLDPQVQMRLEGPEAGPNAKVSWTSASPKVGNGDLTITGSEQDKSVAMALDNNWTGTDKKFTITIDPSAGGKTVKINWALDANYGWDLKARYAGLYIHGDPANVIQVSLNNLAAMLAGFPNIDYKDQTIAVGDVEARPVFMVSTKAKRSLDEVADATNMAMSQIEAAMKKAGLTAAGPRMTITNNWGEEDYSFFIAVPVNAPNFTYDKKDYTIDAPVPPASGESDDDSGETKTYATGERDRNGLLVVDNNVRAALWYGGKVLVSDYTGSPAALPLLRLGQKAYAETHGYAYSETGTGRFWDEITSAPDVADGQQTFRVYLPIKP
jgi:hypothetical protein